MLKRFSILLAGVALTATATGCCCLGGCLGGGYNRCHNPCSPSPCGPGGCAPTYGYPPVGYNSGMEYNQAFAPTTTTISSAPMFGPAYPTTAFAPANSLPTY